MSILGITTGTIVTVFAMMVWFFSRYYRKHGKNKPHTLLPLIFILVGLPFFLNIFTQLAFIFDYPVNSLAITAGVVSLIVCYWLLFKENVNILSLSITLLIACAIVILAAVISTFLWDSSWDGRAYHQVAILAYSDGWNPLQTEIDNIWVDSYPKASWVFGSVVNLVTDKLEAGKSINIIALAATFFSGIYLSSLFQIKSKILSVLIAVAIVGNPVILRQLFTFYLDGYLYLCFVISLIFLISTYKKSNDAHLSEWFIAAMSLALLSNLKFTGFVYAVIILIVIYGFRVMLDKRSDKINYINISAISILAIFIIGANPYLKNILSGDHIFHPVMGSNKHEWVDNIHPPCLKEHNRVSDLILSSFSKTVRSRTCKQVELGLPFNITGRLNEFDLMSGPDWRMGGFGPYFGAVILLSLLLGFRVIVTGEYKNKDYLEKRCLMLIGISILSSTLVNPELWSARYVPQWWLVWLLAALPVTIFRYKLLDKFILYGLLLLLLVTSYQTFKMATKHAIIYTEGLVNMIKIARLNGGVKYIGMDYPFKVSLDHKFKENGIDIIQSNNLLNDVCGIKITQQKREGGYYIDVEKNRTLSMLVDSGFTLSRLIAERKSGETIVVFIRGDINNQVGHISSSLKDAGVQVDAMDANVHPAVIISDSELRWITLNNNSSITKVNGLEIIIQIKNKGKRIVRKISMIVNNISVSPSYSGVHAVKLNEQGMILGYYNFNPAKGGEITSCSLNI